MSKPSLLVSAFSLQMFHVSQSPTVSTDTLSHRLRFDTMLVDDVRGMLHSGRLISAVGHEPTAEFLTQLLGAPVEFNRIDVTFPDPAVASLVVAQIAPGRLKPGVELSADELQSIPVVFWEVTEL